MEIQVQVVMHSNIDFMSNLSNQSDAPSLYLNDLGSI